MKSVVVIVMADENGKNIRNILAELGARFPAVENDAQELIADENGKYPDWTMFLPNPLPLSKLASYENNC